MSTPRNEPCPCGSGKKHKKCCGSGEALDAMKARREAENAKRRAEREAYYKTPEGQAKRRNAIMAFQAMCRVLPIDKVDNHIDKDGRI